MENDDSVKVKKVRQISPIWTIPILSVIIGIILVLSQFKDKGYDFTLIVPNAEGIAVGKTMIKSRSVDVGSITAIELTEDFQNVIIHGVINKNMGDLLKTDSVFWIVRPHIGLSGVSGLSTIISGIYIEIKPGVGELAHDNPRFNILDSPFSTTYEQGVRVILKNADNKVLSVGTPIQYNGFTVGKIESATFDIDEKCMTYVAFIKKPYNTLLTKNVRFWQSGIVDIAINSSGVDLSLPSLDTLVTGAISFSLPKDVANGDLAEDNDTYTIYSNYNQINIVEYSNYKEYILLFESSISGLVAGADVDFRGVRIGTVVSVPYITGDYHTFDELASKIPVLIKIEPERVLKNIDARYQNSINQFLEKTDIRATLKVSNLLTGTAYVDIDLYPGSKKPNVPKEIFGYGTIPTMSVGLTQIQNKLMTILNEIEKMPLENVAQELAKSLAVSRDVMLGMSKLINSKEIQQVPADIRKSLEELNETLKTFQEGSELHENAVTDLKELEKLIKDLDEAINTVNKKSNSLVFEAQKSKDVTPKSNKSKE